MHKFPSLTREPNVVCLTTILPLHALVHPEQYGLFSFQADLLRLIPSYGKSMNLRRQQN